MSYGKFVPVAAVVGLGVGVVAGRYTAPAITDESKVVKPTVELNESETKAKTSPSSFTPKYKENSVYSSLFAGGADTNFEKLARSAFDSTNDIDNSAYLAVLVFEWAKTDSEGALAFAKEKNRSDLLFLALRQMGAGSPDEALNWIKENVSDLTMHGHLMTGVFQGYAKNSPAEAVKKASEINNPANREQILSVAVGEWAKQDIDSVFDWLAEEEQATASNFTYMYDQVVNQYILNSPKKAAAFVKDEMEPGDERANFSSNVAFELAKTNRDEALKWAESLTGDDKEFAINGLLANWAGKEDGIGALDYALKLKDEKNFEDVLSRVAMNLSRSNPDQLKEKLSSLDESQQAIAARQLSQVYSGTSPDKALSLISSLSEGKVKDEALSGAINAFQYNDVSKAFSLSESFSKSNDRVSNMQQVITHWVKIDQFEAEKALTASTAIPESQKEALLKRVYSKVKNIRNTIPIPQ